jgi:quercetin dioxygenase-like cupin family protein
MASAERLTDPAPGHDWVLAGDPERPALISPAPSWGSAAGWIDNLKHYGVSGTVSVLYSKAGAVRANHWHRTDDHALYILTGAVEYYERAVGSSDMPRPQRFGPREMFYTPPMREHAMRFVEDTLMVSISSNTRTHEEHEADVVRVEVIKP